MKPVLVDTDILSMFLRKNSKIVSKFEEYLNEHESISISIITYYEIVSGLKYKNAHKYLDSFSEFAKYNSVLPLSIESVTLAADTYADLRRKGQLIDDIDLLISGIALANNLVLVTNNESHFQRVEGLQISNWKNM
jgi:tRNA(fMet)-specific endonuclease VapC